MTERCDCVAKVDEALATRNTELTKGFSIADGELKLQIFVATSVKEKRRGAKAVAAMPSFCPFCGQDWREETSSAETRA